MATCEKCWRDAYYRHVSTGKEQYECYCDLLEERKYNPCSRKEQSGDWWDEKTQSDIRSIEVPRKKEQVKY